MTPSATKQIERMVELTTRIGFLTEHICRDLKEIAQTNEEIQDIAMSIVQQPRVGSLPPLLPRLTAQELGRLPQPLLDKLSTMLYRDMQDLGARLEPGPCQRPQLSSDISESAAAPFVST